MTDISIAGVITLVVATLQPACAARGQPPGSGTPRSASDLEAGDDDDPVHTRCPAQKCGTHTALMCEDRSHEVATIVAVRAADGRPMRLVADVDRLVGVQISGALIADHRALEGTVIAWSAGGIHQDVRIDRVTLASDPAAEHYWVGAQDGMETYDFSYTVQTPGGPQTEAVRAVAFGGDHYDPMTQRITASSSTDDPVIGCKPGPLHKLHLLGHTTAASTRLGIRIRDVKQQAMLNALTMNACGTGRTFGTPGDPITLSESQSLLPPSSAYQVHPASIEAIWGPNGAVCLDTPRHTSGTTSATRLHEIAAACGPATPPRCTDAIRNSWTDHGDVLTGNPP
jgi:hypothetical protein